jgi:hypothetical protein
MPALNHNPEEIDEGFPEGIYNIRVKYIEFPYTFRSGSTGMRLQFDVWNSDGVGFETWENIVTSSPKAKWKLKEFCFAVGLDYDNPELKSEDFEGKEGKASMHREPGSKWLSVDHYLSVDSVEDKTEEKAVDAAQESVPF